MREQHNDVSQAHVMLEEHAAETPDFDLFPAMYTWVRQVAIHLEVTMLKWIGPHVPEVLAPEQTLIEDLAG